MELLSSIASIAHRSICNVLLTLHVVLLGFGVLLPPLLEVSMYRLGLLFELLELLDVHSSSARVAFLRELPPQLLGHKLLRLCLLLC